MRSGERYSSAKYAPSAVPLRKTTRSAEYQLGAAAPNWYYRALKEKSDPVAVLRRKLRADAAQQPAITTPLRHAIIAQYAAHKGWSVRLPHDNLVALAENPPELNPLPSYATLRRFLKAAGFAKRRSKAARRTEGAERAEARFLDREVRSYEAS